MEESPYATQGQVPGQPAPLIAQPVVPMQGPMVLQVSGVQSDMLQKDMLERGQFICAHCHTQHVTSVMGRGGSSLRKNKNGMLDPELDAKNRKPRPARPRSAVIDGQKVLLCNACGIYWQRKGQKRPLKPVKRTSARKKAKYSIAKEESLFYHAVAEAFSIADADFLWCDCSQLCTTKYLMSDPNEKETLNLTECQQLIEIHKKAMQLKKVKNYAKPEELKQDAAQLMAMGMGAGGGSGGDMDDKSFRGYGRGHASSKEYEQFVFTHIDLCKQKKLCAKFRKKLLVFSNDWLYKRPSLRSASGDDKGPGKMEGKPRVMRDKKFEHSPEELKNATCCSKLCCQKIWTNQIAQWRREYVEGNSDQRWNVIQQMLLGEGYGSSKCVNVVRMITGCSRNLVASVSNYLQINQCTGRPPPRHTQKSEDELVMQQQALDPLKPPSSMHQPMNLSQLNNMGMPMLYNPQHYQSMGERLLGGIVAATISAAPPPATSQHHLQHQPWPPQHPK